MLLLFLINICSGLLNLFAYSRWLPEVITNDPYPYIYTAKWYTSVIEIPASKFPKIKPEFCTAINVRLNGSKNVFRTKNEQFDDSPFVPQIEWI